MKIGENMNIDVGAFMLGSTQPDRAKAFPVYNESTANKAREHKGNAVTEHNENCACWQDSAWWGLNEMDSCLGRLP